MSKIARRISAVKLLFAILLVSHLAACGSWNLRPRPSMSSRPIYHTVQAGDSLSAIAARYRVATDAIAFLNGIRDPRNLQIGSRLYLGYHRSGSRPRLVRASRRQSRAPNTGDTYLSMPVEGARLVSGYGKRGSSFHDGLDFAAPRGTPIYAAHDGLVIYSDDGLSGYGNLIILRAPDGMSTVYAHNRRNLVSVGEQVRRGEQIAQVGSTGRSSGPHLHFEVRDRDARGRYVTLDPLPLLRSNSRERERYRVNERLTPILVKNPGPG